MGGKRLKFPRRAKYVPKEKEVKAEQDKPISEEEHKKRIEYLKSMGLVK